MRWGGSARDGGERMAMGQGTTGEGTTGDAALLTAQESRAADAAAGAQGIGGLALMRAAGAAVARVAARDLPPGAGIAVLCGPGNNGGDGFVAARLLAGAGHRVSLLLLGDRDALKGDAARAAAEWEGPVLDAAGEAAHATLAGADLVIDALFGAGLSRDLAGAARALVEAVNAAGRPVLAIDVPSGIDGDSGAVRGLAVRARDTVALVRRRPGHLLLPGRLHAGRVHVADIGIDEATVAGLAPRSFADEPSLWRAAFPVPTPESHKYTRGHALVLSGPHARTGAARLAARAALRVGAGLVTLASPGDAMAENAAQLTAIMLRPCDGADALAALLADARLDAVVLGPGLGAGQGIQEGTRGLVRAAAGAGRALVLDADALTSFAGEAEALAGLLAAGGARAVLTPHAGEFARLFGTPGAGSKLDHARAAAARTGAVVVLKGADTVIAAPDGRAAINHNGTPWLGTAGAGDVLSGIVGGLLAQGMAPFAAACAGVWLHAAAGAAFGPGLIAEDLPEGLPGVLRGLLGG